MTRPLPAQLNMGQLRLLKAISDHHPSFYQTRDERERRIAYTLVDRNLLTAWGSTTFSLASGVEVP